MTMKVVSRLDPETKRYKAGNDVLQEYNRICEELSLSCQPMSAFVIVVFDDHGHPQWSVHSGEYFPMPTPMLPGVVKDIVTSEVYSR